MHKNDREIQELLIDYALALRDGSILQFLRSLSQYETRRMACSPDFWDAVETVQAIMDVAFAHKAVTPSVGRFFLRVDVRILVRLKKPRLDKHSVGASSNHQLGCRQHICPQ